MLRVARVKIEGGQKWTSEVSDQLNILGFICMVLKSRDLFRMSVFKKLCIVLYSVHWYMYMFILIKSP